MFAELLVRCPVYRAARFYCFSCGFSVVPLRPRSKKRLFDGNHFQTWFPRDDHLRKWFTGKTPYGIAIVPGEVSGNLVIIDFDAPGSYDAWYQATQFDAPCVRSARGVHVYVRVKEMLKNGKGRFQGRVFGDVIAHGNITAPPSVHPSGVVYRWQGDPRRVPQIRRLEDVGVERISPTGGRQLAKRRPVKTTSVNLHGVKHPKAYVNAAVTREYQKIVSTPDGQRNHQLYESALKLAKYTEIISEHQLIQDLQRAALAAGMTEADDGILPTIRSGLRHGQENGVLRFT